MSIDEAIAHAREVAEIQRNNDKLNKTIGKSSPYYNTDCIKCAEEHEQIAEWLEELKVYQQHEIICNKGYNAGYNKAIDDFAEKLNTKCDGMIKEKWNSNVAPMSWAEAYADFKDDIEETTEQLRVGE